MFAIVIRDAYSSDEFAELVARETGRIEFKRGASVRALQDALVAFSNADGGVILIGVTDDREIVGCELTQGVDDRIHDAVAAGHNVGSFTVREIRAGTSPVVAVEVRPRLDGFAQTSDGRLLVRQGARNRALVGDDVRRFLARRHVGTFETTESDLVLDDVEQAVLTEAARSPVTDQLVREVTGMTRAEAGNLLRGLVEQGRLVQEGERRGTTYRLPN